jgi:hypothetical protein
MKHFFTLSLCCLALSLSAQEAITYPYNPDGNADGTITVPDLQDFLGNYGSPFSPAEIMVGDTALGEWIQILYQALEDQQAVIEAMQVGAGGCDIRFPEGYGNHIKITPYDYSGNYYVVPTGKRLYVLGGVLVYVNDILLTSNLGAPLSWKNTNPIILNSGDSLSDNGGSGPGPQSFDCILVNENTSISVINREVSDSNPYIVPSGKEMYVMVLQNNSPRVNNNLYAFSTFIHLYSGDTLSTWSGATGLNGYLVDENYFANCGGGGSSSSASGLDSTAVANMIAEALPTPAAQIGEFRDGGVVFWVDASGQHGLVCDIQDLGVAGWGCNGTSISGADGTAIGSGQQNTIDILVGCSTVGIAAYLCDNSTAQGYSDWFLPGKDALYELYDKQNDINFSLLINGGNEFNYGFYWSSSENDIGTAWEQQFQNGTQWSFNKTYLWNVRAVRAF